MRILLDYRPALRQRTGVGEYAHELVRAVVASPATASQPSPDVVLFSASWKDRLDPRVIPGAEVVDRRVPNQALNFAWHRLGWPPIEMLASGPFEVVHSFHPLLIPTRGAAQVVTIADLDFLDHPERTVREIRRDYAALAAKHAARADHVVAISLTTKEEIHTRLGVPKERITVCTPGAPDWPRREQEPDRGCLLFLGTLEPRKNLQVLLDAYERLLQHRPDAPPLVLAGKQPPSASELIARATRPPLAGHVELPGYVDDATRQALYRRALIFIMPSHNEGFGMPVLEAMTVGVPVVAARRGALTEVSLDGVGRFFEPTVTEELTGVLIELLDSPETREGIREAGWRRSHDVYRWDHSADMLRSAWRQAIELRSRRLRG